MKRALLLAILCAICCSTVVAQDKCSESLKLDETTFSEDLELKYAYVATMSKSEWDTRKANGTLDIVIDDLPIGGTYEEAQAWVRKVRSSMKLDYDMRRLTNIKESRLGPEAAKMYKDCLFSKSKPLYMWVEEDSADVVRLRGIWQPRGGDANLARKFAVYVNGPGKLTSQINPPGTNSTFDVTVRRTNQKEALVIKAEWLMGTAKSRNAFAYSDEIVVQPRKDWKILTEERWFDTATDKTYAIEYAAYSGHTTGTLSYTLSPRTVPDALQTASQREVLQGWQIVTDTVGVMQERSWQNGQIQVSLSPAPNTPKLTERVVLTANFSHNAGGNGAHNGEAMKLHLKWKQQRQKISVDGKDGAFF